ncbi:MAG: 3-oxoacid CoA-transferase subunit B [Colwellia sp.]|nr:3-oxoacid CoA-transferase subunit B [Colwellia sp.]
MNVNKIINRAIQELKYGQIVNLGIGLPTKILDHISPDLDIFFQSENGLLGAKKISEDSPINPELIDAGGTYIDIRSGASFFDSSVSFAMIRRGKVDITFMGAFEVDQEGSLANWKIPGYFSPGIGGAMELAQKTPKVIILCSHNDKKGNSKILKKCKLPLTAKKCITRIITDKAVLDVTNEGLVLKEIAEDLTVEELIAQTDAQLIIPQNIGTF